MRLQVALVVQLQWINRYSVDKNNVVLLTIVGSFSNDDGDGNENVS